MLNSIRVRRRLRIIKGSNSRQLLLGYANKKTFRSVVAIQFLLTHVENMLSSSDSLFSISFMILY
ncbi:MAG: hypothetical protein M3298_01590, partial [Thermoproteota archaeon]|nr:hypothetical protein [Thermoproteota archaeon]